MRILHVTDTSIFNFDGISTYINELLESACTSGETVMLFSTIPLNPKKLRTINHKSVIREFKNIEMFSSDKFCFSLPIGMKKAMTDFHPDIVWIHTIGPLGLRASRLAKNKYPVIYTKHCFDGDLWISHLKIPLLFHWFFHLVARIVESLVLRFTDVAFYHFDNSEKLRCKRFFNKFQYMPPPLSGKFVSETSHRSDLTRDKDFNIGYCGRLDPEKNIGLIFKAIDIFQKKYNKKIRLLLIGEGTEAITLIRQFPDLNVTVTGFVDNVIPYLDQLDVFVLASKTETTSLSSLEAYSRGLPIFSTHVGFLGQNADKYVNIYNFESAEELSSLFNDVLAIKGISVSTPPIQLDPSMITFEKLHELVAKKYAHNTHPLNGSQKNNYQPQIVQSYNQIIDI